MIEEIIGDCRLILGDCLEILPTLGKVDAVVSDVPYGVKERTNRQSNGRSTSGGIRLHSAPGGAKDWPSIVGDDRPFDPTPWLAYPKVILFGANHYCDRLPPSSHWIIWDKREETGPDDNADCELAWTNLKGPARIHRQLWRGICRRGEENVAHGGGRVHPVQKPVALMDFCLKACRLKEGATVLDPYMGSGSTGIAAVRLGLRFVGIETVPQYFETAVSRIRNTYAEAPLFLRSALSSDGRGREKGNTSNASEGVDPSPPATDRSA